MPKELGQIHTVNNSFTVSAPGDTFDVDIPGELSSQLQRMVRQGNYFKIVGVDMNLELTGVTTGGQISGFLRYYAPTKGRCDAYRGAFKAMKEVLKSQGVNTLTNPLYDFRAAFNNDSPTFTNQATLDGVLGLELHNLANPTAGVFAVHNESVLPQVTGGALFSDGFSTVLQPSTGPMTDFVLNDAAMYAGNPDLAAVGSEFIPFSVSWDPGAQSAPVQFQWRPDPALYLAVMCGLVQVHCEQVELFGGVNPVGLNTAVMVSGWKSIMSDRRHSRRKSSKKKSTTSNSRK